MTTELSTTSGQMRPAGGDETTFSALVSMGDALRKTGFLPAHIKDGVSFAAIVLMGRERGIGTMSACHRFSIIKGMPSEKADSQLSRFKTDGGRSRWEQLTEERAVLWLRHPNGDEHIETYTADDAKRAGLLSNENYRKHPKAMLRSRAITAGLKSIGWEGGCGIYDPDELVDIEPAPAPRVTPQRPALPPPAAAPEPQRPGFLARVQAAQTLEELDSITLDAESSYLTFSQMARFRQAITARAAAIDPRDDDGQEHHDAADAAAEGNQ